MTTTSEILVTQYGVLMTMQQLSTVMHRSPSGLRMTLSHNKHDWTQHINAAKRKIGRKVLFITEDIAKVIDGGMKLEMGVQV